MKTLKTIIISKSKLALPHTGRALLYGTTLACSVYCMVTIVSFFVFFSALSA